MLTAFAALGAGGFIGQATSMVLGIIVLLVILAAGIAIERRYIDRRPARATRVVQPDPAVPSSEERKPSLNALWAWVEFKPHNPASSGVYYTVDGIDITVWDLFDTADEARAYLQEHLDTVGPNVYRTDLGTVLRHATPDPQGRLLVVHSPKVAWWLFHVPAGNHWADYIARDFVHAERHRILRDF
ncbi:hypothetical protein [Nocardia sp. BMG111209]|uniref:hypothetical protein n=1 Tax=Nocardia sp. BMG111209 TaxID=1160137 RepID=UPI00037E2AA4|nr:hypothetical protein [Nocardia sp. BMG111209]